MWGEDCEGPQEVGRTSWLSVTDACAHQGHHNNSTHWDLTEYLEGRRVRGGSYSNRLEHQSQEVVCVLYAWC